MRKPLVQPRPRTAFQWAGKRFSLERADEGFSRISGITGSGKSHLTRLFLLDALQEMESNPHAKLIVYEPKRELYAWLTTLGLKSPISYFMPSDKRSVALDFMADYRDDKDAETLAYAFYPEASSQRESPFWGESLRTIYASVYTAIRKTFGKADLRLMCLVLEDEELTRQVLKFDPYQVQAIELTKHTGDSVDVTARNIRYTIQARIGKLRALAAHMDCAARAGSLFSLRRFIQEPHSGVLVISKDEDYGQWQDPMNGVLMLRFTQLLDKEQEDPRRKVFIVIDEFPTLCGNNPCPGVKSMFLRLRSRGAVPLITDQGLTTLKPVYGEDTTAILGQCTNVVYLTQPDVESAEYASKDLGHERGWEKKKSLNFGGEYATINQHEHWYERPIVTATELRNLFTASRARGIEGYARSALYEPKKPWKFTIEAAEVERIPKNDEPLYEEREAATQRLRLLTKAEREAIQPPNADEEKKKPWNKFTM